MIVSDTVLLVVHSSFLPLDELEYRITCLLHQDARLPASKIAQVLGANERTIRNRIDRLIELGAIRLTAVVEPHAFGYVLSTDIFLEVTPEKETEVVNCLLRMPEICYLAYGQCTNEISIEARFESNNEMHDFLRLDLPTISGVHVTSNAMVPRILRNIDEWLPRPEDFISHT